MSSDILRIAGVRSHVDYPGNTRRLAVFCHILFFCNPIIWVRVQFSQGVPLLLFPVRICRDVPLFLISIQSKAQIKNLIWKFRDQMQAQAQKEQGI